MSDSFIEHIKKDVLNNIDMLLATDLSKIADPIIPHKEKGVLKKQKTVKFANKDLSK